MSEDKGKAMASEETNADMFEISMLMDPAFRTIEGLIPGSNAGRVANLVLVGCGRVLVPLIKRIEDLERQVQELKSRAA